MTTEAKIWDETPCVLGEGAFWHPVRQQFFWFDIVKCRMHTRESGRHRTWAFEEHVSAAGWISDTRLLIASSSRLFAFDVESGVREDIHALEADNPVTRSNDGRADPWGGFWIGTMGKAAEERAGAIYRYYKGELRTLYDRVSIPNACCFAPDRSVAYWTDTRQGVIMRQPLNPDYGWPEGDPEPWLDLSAEDFGPDGAVVDAAGNLWNAQWGAGRVAAYAPDGTLLTAISVPADHATCPAFGGPDLTTLFVTTATQQLSDAQRAASPHHGMTFAATDTAKGQPEHQVIL